MTKTDEDNLRAAKAILRGVRTATISVDEQRTSLPLKTVVAVASDIDGAPIVAVAGSNNDIRVFQDQSLCTLLLMASDEAISSETPKLSMAGRLLELEGEDLSRIAGRFHARHPSSVSNSLFRMEFVEAWFSSSAGGRTKVETAQLLTELGSLADWGAREAGAREHMNDDHADAVALYATKLTGAPDGDWILTGIDPEGADMALDQQDVRVWFDEPLQALSDMHHAMIDLVKKARSISG